MPARDYTQEFIKCLQNIDYARGNWAVFQDFLEISSISIFNSFAKNQDLEKRYFELIGKYKSSEKFAKLLAILALALEEKHQDFLGNIYMQCNLANKSSCQFFTPYHVSELMAQLVIPSEDVKSKIEEQGYITVCEPCCGAGGMIIAASEVISKIGYNPQHTMWFKGVDIDINCCRMTYIQTSLLGLSGEVIHGDTLKNDYWKRLITPMYLFNMQNFKTKTEIQEKPEERIKNDRKITIEQLSFFAK